MDIATSSSKERTWEPAWKRDPNFSALFKPYSMAGVTPVGDRPQPELWDICNGCILWLPPKAKIGEIQDGNLASQPEALFDHPILVLNIAVTGPQSATVQFVIVTSNGKRPLSNIPALYRDQYLPIFPTEAHPNSGILLHPENEAPKRGMTDPSYVCMRQGPFSLDYKALRCYAVDQRADAYRHRLTKESFQVVVRELDFIPSPWIETKMLWEDFVQKHVTPGAA